MKWFSLIVLFLSSPSWAQDSAATHKKWMLNGYVKDMQTLSFNKNFDSLVSGNLVHNRINVKWKPVKTFTMAAEFRNRLFWGEDISKIPNYADQLRNENELVNMSVIWIQKSNFVLHTNVERLWMEYSKSKWTVRLGRQRINWGITTTWNPNDIFNTYNFLDFDYEERPGTDAAKAQYLLNDFSHIEMAIFPGNSEFRPVGALKYYVNKSGYDIQLLAGIYQNRFTMGTGWAGSIKDAGFKGEIQYFLPGNDSAGVLNISLESDYVFKNGWYINGSLLFNSEGLSQPVTDWDNFNFKLSPVSLMPTEWNFMVGTGKEFTPRFSGNLGFLYAPGTNLVILLPSFKYNLATDLDADLVWQSFFSELEDGFSAVNHRIFLRLKWSF